MAGYGYGQETWGMQTPAPGAPTGFAGPQNPNSRDSRYRKYLALLQQGAAPGPVAPQRRGGASPYPYMAGAESPTADSIDLLNDQSLYLRGISDSSIAPPDRPVYSPGYRAPPRRIFARRGYRGQLQPGDQMTVGEAGPETVTVQNPAGVQVTPNNKLIPGPYGSALDPTDINLLMSGRFAGGSPTTPTDGYAGVESARANAVTPELTDEQLRAQIYAQSPANARRRSTRASAAPIVAPQVPDYAPPNPQNFDGGGVDMRGSGEKMIFDRNRARQQAINDQQAGSDSRTPDAQAQINATKNTAGTPMTLVETEARRKAAGLPSLADQEAHRQSVREILRGRSLDRSAAVEEFGTDRPMAIGALRELRRQRALQQQTVDADNAAKLGSVGLKSSQAHDANKAKYLSEYAKANPGASPDQVAAAGQGFDAAMGGGQDGSAPEAPASKGLSDVAASADPYIESLANAPGGAYVTPSEERQFTTNADLMERHLDDIDKSQLSAAEKRQIATAILEKANKSWTTEIFGRAAFKDRRNKIHARLRKMAGLG